MLPPQLRSGTAVSKYRISSSNALRASRTAVLRAPTAHAHSRSFWNGPHRWDWVSQLDPVYQRYARVRTLKTRAKLLKSIRRRGAFEWDGSTRPFFTPRHLRWASHWRGRQWYTNDDPKQQMKDEAAAEEEKRTEEDGYELSKREREWKEQMEAMRKRIAQDPYEAIFGKRFEPFWSPLVPSWMREEMGLQGWPKEKIKEAEKTIASANKSGDTIDPAIVELRNEIQKRSNQSSIPATKSQEEFNKAMASARETTVISSQAATASSKPFSRMTKEERIKHVLSNAAKQNTSEPASTQPPPPRSYAYSSSTSWDSVSNKTRKVEWDSKSNQTKKFEYDPISNRMIEVETPSKVAIDSDSSAVRQSAVRKLQADISGLVREPNKAVNIPVKQSSDVRKSIPIPPPLSQPSHSVTLGYTQTSVGPLRSTAVSSPSIKPAALAKLPARDLDMLTADHVRASMGKVKQTEPASKATTVEEKAELERDFEVKSRMQDEVDAILKERAASKGRTEATSAWDRAELTDMFEREVDSLQKKKEKLMKDERGLFHIERQKRELQKLDERIRSVTKRVDAMNLAVVETAKPASLQTSLQRAEAKKTSPLLQSSVDRMQSRDLPKAPAQDLDDAAAHESTEPVAAHAGVPKGWAKAADVLQADRVRRTAAKRPYPMTRWIDDMNARKVAFEQRKAETQMAEDAKNAESNAKLEKSNKMLQAEVAEQKFRMQAFEGRYAHKVKSLRGELDTAFKQSSVHSEKHVERIRELEKINEVLQAEVAEHRFRMQASEGRYAHKVKSLRGELDTAFKQSSVHSGMHVEEIRELQAQLSGLREKESKYADKVKDLRGELERAYKQSNVHAMEYVDRIKYLQGELETATKVPVETQKPSSQIYPAEGDLCMNAPHFGENGKWYKRPANPPQLDRAAIEKAEQKAYDQVLVEEVQGIYENEYGVIDENHEQPEVGAEESAAMTLAFNNAEKQQQAKLTKKAFNPKKQAEKRARRAEEKDRQVVEVESDVDLGEELAKYEKENPEAYKADESLTAPESAQKIKGIFADSIEQELALPRSHAKAAVGVQWADPPLYKVLAYDSGNDMMSSATTTTSILPGSAEERPLGIPEALGQLYQPARFVPYFAELQSDNFQAIAATREVIVFRQVKKPEEPAKKSMEPRRPKAALEDHGLQSLKTRLEAEIRTDDRSNSDVNPIDGTSRRQLEPTTGNFASPTGFVNHDPVFPPETNNDGPPFDAEAVTEVQSDTYSTIAKEPITRTSRQIWESLPGSNETPVKRTESVFSGYPIFSEMTKKERSQYGKEQQRMAHERGHQRNLQRQAMKAEQKRIDKQQKRERKEALGQSREQSEGLEQNQYDSELHGREREQYDQDELDRQYWEGEEQGQGRSQNFEQSRGRPAKSSSDAGGSAFRYALGAGLSTATVMYLVGALAERQREPASPAEREARERVRKWEAEKRRLEDEAARLAREWERR